MEQLSIFDFEEIVDDKIEEAKKLGTYLVKLLNSLDTRFKGSFYFEDIKLERWEHIGDKNRHLTIGIWSKIADYYENCLLPGFGGKANKDHITLNDAFSKFNHMVDDKDFTASISPTGYIVFWRNFDNKKVPKEVIKC